MGYQEQFAQRTFAEETERITGGAVGWQDPPEIRLEKVQSDGFLVLRRPRLPGGLAAPWSLLALHAEVMLELKLAGNHLDRRAAERGLLRRQARQVQRVEEDASWSGEEPLWIVAPHMPDWLDRMRQPARFAPGCYWVEPQWHRFLWIAANELPLTTELIPFLLARSGRPLDEFVRWVAPQRPLDWVINMLDYLPMSTPTHEDLVRRYAIGADDPELMARRRKNIKTLVNMDPQLIQEFQEEGQVRAMRANLRRVLVLRGLTLSGDADSRIDACTDLATLERWHDQAVTALTVADALA